MKNKFDKFAIFVGILLLLALISGIAFGLGCVIIAAFYLVGMVMVYLVELGIIWWCVIGSLLAIIILIVIYRLHKFIE